MPSSFLKGVCPICGKTERVGGNGRGIPYFMLEHGNVHTNVMCVGFRAAPSKLVEMPELSGEKRIKGDFRIILS